ncbi:hypothetical protein Dsin_012551 [Dipteronia sinensis]|uniref:Uncharacterized protein n=1 Tax=Dipteronia sinensis TaxID=43782 RepID=A0AAE0AIG9_9ROSI|nr:hypothetical protein Dsin_012551 [Dipteronia sinensis]
MRKTASPSIRLGRDLDPVCSMHATYIAEELKVTSFYSGLTSITQMLVNNACGGTIVDKRVIEAREILEKLALNSKVEEPPKLLVDRQQQQQQQSDNIQGYDN